MTINQRKHVPMRRGSLFLKHPICCKYKEGVSWIHDTPPLNLNSIKETVVYFLVRTIICIFV